MRKLAVGIAIVMAVIMAVVAIRHPFQAAAAKAMQLLFPTQLPFPTVVAP
jgi:hypothetical protein